ncbi:hypothetical protein EXU48_01505 [Occultella glacieicola]|uniref:MFS transporter n=1 Tax=Occultella glacieicola TaxID=2518684 RepID=A0ABY2E8R6_9MICO|nr:hypothetical protein [Occultella glacieicola]TDE98900.1 hypothetical protein EXU48_01505 [Occultella glacieicola]
MTDPRRGPLRLLRATAVSVSVIGLALGAHVGAGGSLGDLLVVAAAGAFTMLVAFVACGRRLRAVTVLALLGAGQVTLHHVFASTAGLGAVPGCTTAGAHTHGAALAEAMQHCAPAGGGHALTMTMLGAHLLATVINGALLWRGDRALFALWTWLTPLLTVLSERVLPTPAAVGRGRRRSPTPRRPDGRIVWLDLAPRRGPPLARAAA